MTTAEQGATAWPISGVFNLRDLSGVGLRQGSIRSGAVYRSDGLHRTDEAGAAAIAELGIKRVIDLRTKEERDHEGFFEHDEISTVHLPIMERMTDLIDTDVIGVQNSDRMLSDSYAAMIERSGERVGDAVTLVAGSVSRSEPVLFHCTAGKDRTGVVAALIAGVAGATLNAIAEDYAQSASAMEDMAAWYLGNRGQTPSQAMVERGLDPSLATVMMGADRGTIIMFLAEFLSEHGSFAAWAHSLGVAEQSTDIIERSLVEFNEVPGSSGGAASLSSVS